MYCLICWHFFCSSKQILVEPNPSGSCANTPCTVSPPFVTISRPQTTFVSLLTPMLEFTHGHPFTLFGGLEHGGKLHVIVV